MEFKVKDFSLVLILKFDKFKSFGILVDSARVGYILRRTKSKLLLIKGKMAEVREGRKRKYLDDYCERQAKYSRGSGFDFQNVPEQTRACEGVNIFNE